MKIQRFILVGIISCAVWVGNSKVTRAADDGQIGFIVNNEFSSFLSVNGEIAFDFFAVLLDIPSFEGIANLDSQFLSSIGFLPAIFFGADPFEAFASFLDFGEEFGLFKFVFSPDPFILYEYNIENTTDAPMEILFSISPPIVPVIGDTRVISQLNVNLIDKNNDGTVFIDAGGATLQDFFIVDDRGILQNAGVDLGGDINTEGLSSFSIPETAGPVSPSASGWEFMDVVVFFKLSPGDQVIMRGMVGVGSPGTPFPNLDEVDFESLENIGDCLNDGNDDDDDGVPNGCDQCPGEDDQIDDDEDGVPDCANDVPPNGDDDDDGGDNDVPPVDDNDDGGADDGGNGNGDGDGDGAPVVPPATFCAFGTFNMVPLMLFGLVALRKRRNK
ncbi:MAG: hypothetical protein MI923_15520 [Phycisphaerales bacterium]|nr:hypothetical protein [Phycisphaerales bacterium]